MNLKTCFIGVLLVLLGLGYESQATFTYTHNWVDDKGVSHLTECAITNLTESSLGPGVQSSFLERLGPATGIVFNVMEPQKEGVAPIWHRNPFPQLVMFQSGVANWTVSGPVTRMFGPGDIMFGEDQKAVIGHQSSARGITNLTMAVMQFADWTPRVNQPCWLK